MTEQGTVTLVITSLEQDEPFVTTFGASDNVLVTARNHALMPTTHTWVVTEERARELHIGQVVEVTIAIEESENVRTVSLDELTTERQ